MWGIMCHGALVKLILHRDPALTTRQDDRELLFYSQRLRDAYNYYYDKILRKVEVLT